MSWLFCLFVILRPILNSSVIGRFEKKSFYVDFWLGIPVDIHDTVFTI